MSNRIEQMIANRWEEDIQVSSHLNRNDHKYLYELLQRRGIEVLGETWRPDLKLVSVINALHYLLSDPNPDSVFDHPECLKVAKICKKHGFPLYKENKEEPEEISKFNIVPVPNTSQDSNNKKANDIIRFKIFDK